MADTSQGPWSRVTGGVVALVASEDRLHRYPHYVVDFLGRTLGIGHLFQYQRQRPGLVTLTRWFFRARLEHPAIVVAARAKPLASSAVAEKRNHLIEWPVKPSFIPQSDERLPVKFPYTEEELETADLRFTRPTSTRAERRNVRPVVFEREREIAGQPMEFSREKYLSYGVPEAHAELLAKGYIPGLRRFWQPKQQQVDAPNMIFAVLPGPGALADVRDLYVSFDKDDGETILVAQGLRPPSLFLDTNPVIEKFHLDVGLVGE
jgi:hypothetical protein